MNPIADALRKFTSLDTPKDQNLGETAAEFALSFVPGLGQAQALRDFERARRDQDKLGMALSAASLIPGGKILSKGREIYGGWKGMTAAEREAAKVGKELRAQGMPESYIWEKTKTMADSERKNPIVRIDDSQANWKVDPRTVKGPKPLGEVFDHPELFQRYPELAQYDFVTGPNPGFTASFYPAKKQFGIHTSVDPAESRPWILHELQHGVDRLEGREYGTNSGTGQALADMLRQRRDVLVDAKKYERIQQVMNTNPNMPATERMDLFQDVFGPRWQEAYKNYAANGGPPVSLREAVQDLTDFKNTAGAVTSDARLNYLRNQGERRARGVEWEAMNPTRVKHYSPEDVMSELMADPVKLYDIVKM